MAITKTQGYKLDSPQQNFVRDSFATVSDMLAYNEDLLPEVFHASVEDTGKMYTYWKSRPSSEQDPTTGKWVEVGSGGSDTTEDSKFIYKGDDAAWVRSQGKCRMPTEAEWMRLYWCTGEYVTDYQSISGLNGTIKYSSVNPDEYIFLPDAGYMSESGSAITGWYFWTSTVNSAVSARFCSASTPYGSVDKSFGMSIRPVCTTDEFDEIPEGYVEMTTGVYWAPYNLDVNPKKLSSAAGWYGGYYAWGEIAPYGECDPTNWANGERTKKETYNAQYTKYYNNNASMYVKYNLFDNLTTLEHYKVPVGLDIGTCDDPIFIRSDGRYECAIYEDFRDGLIGCSKEWKTDYKGFSGLNGWYYTSSVDSSKGIFIPANGLFNGTAHDNTGSYCYLWTASCYGSSSDNYVNAWSIQGNNSVFAFSGAHKRWGFGMRACWNEANHPGETPPQGFVEMVDGYWWSPVNVGMIRWDKYSTECECVYGSWFSWGEIVGYNDTIDASDNHNYGALKTDFSASKYKWLNTTGSYSMPRKYNGYDGMSGFAYSRYPYDGALTEAESGVPVGTILPTILQTAPPGWLICDGHSELIKDYPKLHQALLITKMNSGNADVYYGIFRLPDLRANILIGGGINDVVSATKSFMGEQHTRTYSGGSAQEYARFGVNYIIKAK